MGKGPASGSFALSEGQNEGKSGCRAVLSAPVLESIGDVPGSVPNVLFATLTKSSLSSARPVCYSHVELRKLKLRGVAQPSKVIRQLSDRATIQTQAVRYGSHTLKWHITRSL